MLKQDFIFYHSEFGDCRLKYISNSEKIIELDFDLKTKEKFLKNLADSLKKDKQKHYHNLYEIHSPGKYFLGIAGNCFLSEEKNCSEIFVYLAHNYSDESVVRSILDILIDSTFKSSEIQKIIISHVFENNLSDQFLIKYGFAKRNHQYEFTKFDRNLQQLSKAILQEAKFMVPQSQDFAKDLSNRVARLWYTHFSKGILLSSGGVEESFIKVKDWSSHQNLRTFNVYRSDRENSVFFTQDMMKKFLVEENIISNVQSSNLFASFSLGSHEGIMRIARCIYKIDVNEEIFFSSTCYGLLATALAHMEPVNYKVHLIDIDRKNGEKILLSDFKKLSEKYPKAKTLCLELKTIAGAIYTREELKEIISFCKKNEIFLIADATHYNMEFKKNSRITNVTELCLQLDYHEFSVVYTGSKTYGLERARIGFMVFSEKIKSTSTKIIDTDLYRVIGAGFDLPFEVAALLIKSPVTARQKYLVNCNEKHRFNMNLMLAYVQGTDSSKIDEDLKSIIHAEIEPNYRGGIKGLRVVYKPEGGIHMKIDTSGLKNKYIANIKMLNSEIFCYALNKIGGVVTLHSYCILDPQGYGMRLTFSAKKDVHEGMKAMHNFVKMLSGYPSQNRFLPEIYSTEAFYLGISTAMECSSYNFFPNTKKKSFDKENILSDEPILRARL